MNPDIEIEPEPLGTPEPPPAWATSLLDAETALAALLLAALAAMLIALLAAVAGKGWRTVGVLLAMGAGVVLGCLWLDIWPNWPPQHDRGRFLLVLLPATVLAECFCACVGADRQNIAAGWLAPWLVRAALSLAAGPILLHGSTYLGGILSEHTWSLRQSTAIFATLGAGLFFAWFLLANLAQRRPSRTLIVGLALTLLGSAAIVMEHGRFTGGLVGLPFAGALLGIALATFVAPTLLLSENWVAPAVVGLFAILVMGRFFATLGVIQALVLFLAPLGFWITEAPHVRTLKPWARSLAGLACVSLPVAVVLAVTFVK